MNPSLNSRPLLRFALIGLALAALALPGSAIAANKRVAREGTVASLGEKVLTNNSGRTLYSLSVEKHGKFICTGGCLGTWHPLVVAQGTKPTGPRKLGTVERPDGRTQVTFQGRPLYSFAGDRKPGEANGEGFKDVGTWHAASIGKTSTESNPPPQEPAPSPYPDPAPPANPAPSPSPSPPPSPYPPYPYSGR